MFHAPGVEGAVEGAACEAVSVRGGAYQPRRSSRPRRAGHHPDPAGQPAGARATEGAGARSPVTRSRRGGELRDAPSEELRARRRGERLEATTMLRERGTRRRHAQSQHACASGRVGRSRTPPKGLAAAPVDATVERRGVTNVPRRARRRRRSSTTRESSLGTGELKRGRERGDNLREGSRRPSRRPTLAARTSARSAT